jgi:hypothetical protein
MAFANNSIAILIIRVGSHIGAKPRLGKPALDTRRCPAGRRVVILRVFAKKTQKTPRREIELARQRAKEVR